MPQPVLCSAFRIPSPTPWPGPPAAPSGSAALCAFTATAHTQLGACRPHAAFTPPYHAPSPTHPSCPRLPSQTVTLLHPPTLAAVVARPIQTLGPHVAALGLRIYNRTAGQASAFPAEYDGAAFIALHGSWNRWGTQGWGGPWETDLASCRRDLVSTVFSTIQHRSAPCLLVPFKPRSVINN